MDEIKQNLIHLVGHLWWDISCHVSHKYEWIHEMADEVDRMIAPFLPDVYEVYDAKECDDKVLFQYHFIQQRIQAFLDNFQDSCLDL